MAQAKFQPVSIAGHAALLIGVKKKKTRKREKELMAAAQLIKKD